MNNRIEHTDIYVFLECCISKCEWVSSVVLFFVHRFCFFVFGFKLIVVDVVGCCFFFKCFSGLYSTRIPVLYRCLFGIGFNNSNYFRWKFKRWVVPGNKSLEYRIIAGFAF